ncbi:ABC transporter permease [Paractinoplanes abujensis]|uniref:Putative ABC transport system permease protein n=1 Tax=Paractinoplanes abujensis TaxID=882441 RepID=A0A7W7G6C3_9ACTN|nr:ABC transporter permease [Actinoplanes abujensis]MBB4697449.1 putative ABC transport system permease protein [Actinoplanes abujensis]GID18076.1 ABC transporter permease [Actinoplanes abujensis]
MLTQLLRGGMPARDRLGALIAVLLGTAVVTLTLTLLASAGPERPDRFAAVTVAVRSAGVTTPADPFPETRPWPSDVAGALAERLAGLPGVEAAVPDHRFYAQPVRSGRPVAEIQEGYGWASATLAGESLIAGRPADAPGEVVLGEDLRVPVGGTVTILTAAGPATWKVTGLVRAARLYVTDAEAARLAPGVRVIGLTGNPDPADVRAAAGGATVLSEASLGDLEPRGDARTRWIGLQVLSAMAALSVFSCVFVVASTLALSVNQRRREIGLLRAVGATPRQVRFTVLREAAVVGLTAAVVGTASGLALSPWVGSVLVDAGFEPESFQARLQWWPPLTGVLIGPVVAVAGGLMAARRAARVRPLDALRSAEVETRPMTRGRWLAGLVFAGAGIGAAVATVVTDDLADLGAYALLGAMALVVAAALLAPAVVPLIVRLMLRPVRGALGTVVRESALTGARRTASTAAPVLLTVAFAVFIAGNVQTAETAYADRRADAAQAGTVLMPDGTPGLTDSAAPAAALFTSVYVNDTVLIAAGLPPDGPAEAPDPDALVLNRSRAAQLGREAGDQLTLVLADGQEKRLRVSAVLPDDEAAAEVVLARATVRRHDPSALAPAQPVGSATASPAPVGARLVDVATYARESGSEKDRLVWIFTLLLVGVSVGYGALAVANTLFMATGRRANDYRLLRLAGATPRQVLVTVAGESALVVLIGSILGGSAALLALWGTAAGFREQTGTSVTLTVPWAVATAAVGACLLLALVGSLLPARAQLTGSGAVRERA